MRPAAASASGHELVLGRYRPLSPLGSGGSGSVWLARDEVAQRDVALKVVPREGKAGDRAEREAVAASRLRNRHCARAYAVERDERHVYVVYEYLRGRTLREALRSGELSDAAAVEAAAQVLDALAHAHAKGIVHRDVKPANILAVDGEGVSVRLLDFGLAQLEGADTLTAAGDVPGTLAYIAPERLTGAEATGAADVWAVGVILWEALAGYQPFFTASPIETARLIGAGAPSVASVRPDLPRRLVQAVDRALSLDPRRRPAPRRLATELRASLAATAERRRRRPLASRRVLIERAGGATLAAAFTGLAVSLLSFFPPSWTPALAGAAALAAFLEPRAGLAVALAAPILPLGDVSFALAVVYVGAALAWLVLSWRDARHGLLLAAGPVLGLVGLLALMPLLAERARGTWRQALHAGAGVILAALVAGLRGAPLPFSGERPPRGLGLAGSDNPGAVLGALWRAFAAHPAVGFEALVLAAAAATLPVARGRGLAGAASLGACFLVLGILVPPLVGAGRVEALPLVLGALALTAAVAAPAVRRERRQVRGGTRSRARATTS